MKKALIKDISELIELDESKIKLDGSTIKIDHIDFKTVIDKLRDKYIALGVEDMKQVIMDDLSKLEYGYSKYKWSIERDTGIPMYMLTVLLKQLKIEGKIELDGIFDEATGLLDGTGYHITYV